MAHGGPAVISVLKGPKIAKSPPRAARNWLDPNWPPKTGVQVATPLASERTVPGDAPAEVTQLMFCAWSGVSS